MSKVAIKGQIIDEHCPIKGELIEHNGKVYSCTLNQTDIDANKNKFYIMQLIKNGTDYTLYTRWGRVSEKGRPTTDPYSSQPEGITAFEKQFRTKTGNVWGTNNFVKKAGKYFMSDVSYEDEFKNIPNTVLKIPDSKLPERVQNLIKMLSDVNMMQNSLVSLDIDPKKMPLGKIKQSQLDKAGEVLDKVQLLVNKKGTEAELVALSSEYYTYLPMGFARKRPPVINSDEIIGKYRDTIDELKNIVINVQITENTKAGDNPIDSIYNDIKTIIKPLEKDSVMWKEIEKYIANTHGQTHGCKLEIIDIFEIAQAGKKEKYDKYCQDQGIDNKTLLFHGSGMANWLSIMKNDFYLDPAKMDKCIVISGKMFGAGCYFADSSKSFGYTRAEASNNIGCYIIGEIALGKQLSKFDSDYTINKKSLTKTGHHSTKGEGRWQPSSETIVDGIKIPNGKLHEKHKNASLRYNEYIVYDTNQILSKYFIVLKNIGTYKGY